MNKNRFGNNVKLAEELIKLAEEITKDDRKVSAGLTKVRTYNAIMEILDSEGRKDLQSIVDEIVTKANKENRDALPQILRYLHFRFSAE